MKKRSNENQLGKLLAGLSAAVRRRFGDSAKVENIVVPTLGAINRTIIFDCVVGSQRRRMVSREETYQDICNPFLRPARQFEVMRIVHAHGFPVPEPIFMYDDQDAMGEGFVTEYVEGETMPKRILRDPAYSRARDRFAVEAGTLLASLHRLDTEQFAFLESEPDSIDPVAALRNRLDAYEESHPAIELGLRWLERNRPKRSRRVLVHGDFRLGNLMIGETSIRAVLDWECSHIGSGLEDIGWLCARSWRFGNIDRPVGGIADRATLYAAYADAGGERIDPEEARYWEIMGLVRWAIINVMQAYGHVHRGRRGVTFAAMGRNASLIEYELLMTMAGHYD